MADARAFAALAKSRSLSIRDRIQRSASCGVRQVIDRASAQLGPLTRTQYSGPTARGATPGSPFSVSINMRDIAAKPESAFRDRDAKLTAISCATTQLPALLGGGRPSVLPTKSRSQERRPARPDLPESGSRPSDGIFVGWETCPAAARHQLRASILRPILVFQHHRRRIVATCRARHRATPSPGPSGAAALLSLMINDTHCSLSSSVYCRAADERTSRPSFAAMPAISNARPENGQQSRR